MPRPNRISAMFLTAGGGGGGPGVYNPLDLPEVILDIDPGISSSVTLNSGFVEAIADQSSANNDATQTTSGNRGTIAAASLNGYDTFYVASTKSIEIPGTFLSAWNTRNIGTFYVVMRYAGAGGYTVLFDSTSRHLSLYANSGNGKVSLAGVGGTNGAPGGVDTDALIPNTWYIVSFVVNPTFANIYVNGKGSLFTGFNGGNFTSALSLGGAPSGGGFAYPLANYARAIGCNLNHSKYNRQQIEGYLAHYYGITSVLDAGHPYKTSPPVAETILVRDTFTDSDSTALASHTPELRPGSNAWVASLGTWQIQGCAARLTSTAGDGQNVAVIDSGVANASVVMDALHTSAAPDFGIVANYVDQNNFWMCVRTNNEIKIWERSGGTFTQRANATLADPGSGATETFKVVTNNDTIEIYVNSVLQVSYTVASRPHKTATKHGLRNFQATTGDFLYFEVT